METPIDIYRRVAAEQPVCDDAWFAAVLAKARTGDDEARSPCGADVAFAPGAALLANTCGIRVCRHAEKIR